MPAARPEALLSQRVLRLLFARVAKIAFEMQGALAIELRRIPGGWAVGLTDGRELMRFRGLGAHWRAVHYLQGLIG